MPQDDNIKKFSLDIHNDGTHSYIKVFSHPYSSCGVIVFKIPRDSWDYCNEQLADYLNFSYIYILTFDSIDDKTDLYVGQASSRNSGQPWARIHDHLRDRLNSWNTAYILLKEGDNLGPMFDPNSLNYLENTFYNYFKDQPDKFTVENISEPPNNTQALSTDAINYLKQRFNTFRSILLVFGFDMNGTPSASSQSLEEANRETSGRHTNSARTVSSTSYSDDDGIEEEDTLDANVFSPASRTISTSSENQRYDFQSRTLHNGNINISSDYDWYCLNGNISWKNLDIKAFSLLGNPENVSNWARCYSSLCKKLYQKYPRQIDEYMVNHSDIFSVSPRDDFDCSSNPVFIGYNSEYRKI